MKINNKVITLVFGGLWSRRVMADTEGVGGSKIDIEGAREGLNVSHG